MPLPHFHGLAEVIFRCTCVYLFLLLGLRIAGKRELGQMTLFDLVVILIISNAVQNAMVGDNTTLQGGLVAAATLLVVNSLVTLLRLKFAPLERLLGGVPTPIIADGKFLEDNIHREHLSEDLVMQALREHGVDDVTHVQKAMLENDGSISVVPVEGKAHKRKRPVKFLRH
jgi:uncharacterized membrane protein YcaP (DUF421 family)